MSTLSSRQLAHELVERIPDSDLATAVRFLEFILIDPVLRAAAVREPVDRDLCRLQEGEAWFADHGGRPRDGYADFAGVLQHARTGSGDRPQSLRRK